jgi:hypothetical protein
VEWNAPYRSHTPIVEQHTKKDQGRVLELRDLCDGTAHLQFRDQLPSEVVEQIRTLLNRGREGTLASIGVLTHPRT